MKHLSYLISLLLGVFALGLTSCAAEEEQLEDEVTVAEQRQAIVGYWYDGVTDEYWHFFAGTASAAAPAQGKNWCETDEVYESDVDPFQWYIESNGLMVIHSVGGSFNNPDPECPIKIRSITEKNMIWDTADGETRTLNKQIR